MIPVIWSAAAVALFATGCIGSGDLVVAFMLLLIFGSGGGPVRWNPIGGGGKRV